MRFYIGIGIVWLGASHCLAQGLLQSERDTAYEYFADLAAAHSDVPRDRAILTRIVTNTVNESGVAIKSDMIYADISQGSDSFFAGGLLNTRDDASEDLQI